MKSWMICLLLFLTGSWARAQQSSASVSVEEDWFSRSKDKIFANEEERSYEQNLSIFEEGHRRGYFYFLHPALPRYEPYLKFPAFEGLAERDRQLYERALEQSSTSYHLELPVKFDNESSYPLFIIFHGGNSNLQRLRKHWNEEDLDRDFIKVYLQSYRHFDSESFTWRSGDRRTDRDLFHIYSKILKNYLIDTSQVIVAGISAGANYAIGMALRGVLPVDGILAICPGLPQVLRSGTSIDSLCTDFTAYIVGGEHDFYLDFQHRLTEIFDTLEVAYRYRLVEGMGHQYPENEVTFIKEGLRFIRND